MASSAVPLTAEHPWVSTMVAPWGFVWWDQPAADVSVCPLCYTVLYRIDDVKEGWCVKCSRAFVRSLVGQR